MKKYDHYKDSGIEWIGEIPEHWEVNRMRYLGFLYGGLTGKSGKDFNQEKNPQNKYFIPFTNIYNNLKIDVDNLQTVVIEQGENQNLVKKGDLFFLMSSENYDDVGKSSVLTKEIEETYLNSFCKGFRIITEEIKSDFLNYLLHSKPLRHTLMIEANGFTRINLKMDKISDLRILLPSESEQIAIANYLDKKTTEIDELIADKEELLKLYAEEKTAVINQAVTKGIDSDVKMKDSGIEWLGEIPEHWETVKLNGICNLVRGNTNFKKDELLSEGKYVALQYGKTYKVNEVNNKYQFYVNDEFYKASQIVNYGDVIFISTSETIEDLGHSVYYNRKDIGLLGGEQILLKTRMEIINGKYLYYSSITFAKELRKYATGIKVFRFNINDLKKTYIAFPPIKEQQSIVDFIESETTRIDTKIENTQRLIALLKEYREALISEVVTGKVKVI